MAPAILTGRESIQVTGDAAASGSARNFVISGNPSDVLNYARKGNDLVVEMKDGRIHTIRNFAGHGFDFNKLVFAEDDTLSAVDFSNALSTTGDGIVEAAVTVQAIGAGLSTAALLGILGAAAGAVAISAGEDTAESSDPADPAHPTGPSNPEGPGDPVDTTAPGAPTIGFATDTGALDHVTGDNTLTFSGMAEALAKVEIFIDGTSIGTAVADGNGFWSFDYTGTALPDGDYIVTARATDPAGNISTPSPDLHVTIDTATPTMPSIMAISTDTGAPLDHVTGDNTLTFSGMAEALATVEIFIDGTSIGTTVAGTNGVWLFDHTGTALPDGDCTVTALVRDAAGNLSPLSLPYVLTVDTSADAPVITGISEDGGSFPDDGVTDDNALVFSGTAEARATVELFIDGTSIGTTIADTHGAWSFDHTGTILPNGAYSVTATATDIAGNVSAPSTGFALTVDAPAVTVTGDTSIIVFTFSEAVDAASFSESDIIVANGMLVPSTLTQIDPLTWQAVVQPDLPDPHTNISVTLAPGSVLTANGIYFAEGRNTTSLDMLFMDPSTPAGDVTGWDTSHATSAYGTFYANDAFNQDIGGWDVSNITNMTEMFAYAAIFNQDISGWNTRSLSSMEYMFSGASAFDQAIGDWNVGNVTNMDAVFEEATAFNQDLDHWDTSGVTSMFHLFYNAAAFNGLIGSWSTGAVTKMSEMLSGASSFNQYIGDWNTGNVQQMDQMFRDASSFNQDIGGWNVGSVTIMSSMFYNAAAFNQDLDGWDVSNVEMLDGMFSGATAFDGDISTWNTGLAKSLSFMFRDAAAFNQDIGGWNTASVTLMIDAFSGATSFNQDIGNWDVGNVLSFQRMFYGASAFNGDIGDWDTAKVTSMKSMFQNATAFDQNLAHWDISALKDADGMFAFGGMSVENTDATLRGWAKLDTAAGETAIQMNVQWDIGRYTDITALVYLEGKYHWQIGASLEASVKWDSSLTGTTLDYSSSTAGEIIHGLYGDDIIIGGSGNDRIVGGTGDDTLTGNGGRDIFHFGFEDQGTDTITDFQTGPAGDIIHIADLLIGYNPASSTLSDFVTAGDNGGDLELSFFYKGGGGSTPPAETVRVILSGISPTASLDDLIDDGNLVLV